MMRLQAWKAAQDEQERVSAVTMHSPADVLTSGELAGHVTTASMANAAVGQSHHGWPLQLSDEDREIKENSIDELPLRCRDFMSTLGLLHEGGVKSSTPNSPVIEDDAMAID